MSSIGIIGGIPMRSGSLAADINNQSQIVGWSSQGDLDPLLDGVRHAFVKTGSLFENLGIPPGVPPGGFKSRTEATAINDQGQVVGWSGTGGRPRAFLWQNGTIENLGAFGPGEDENDKASQAYDINNVAQIVGYTASNVSNSLSPALWLPVPQFGLPDGINKLDGLGGTGVIGEALAINDNGVIVGQASTPDGPRHATIWVEALPIDLNTFLPPESGWVLLIARDINDENQVVGTGTLNGEAALYMLDLPASIVP